MSGFHQNSNILHNINDTAQQNQHEYPIIDKNKSFFNDQTTYITHSQSYF